MTTNTNTKNVEITTAVTLNVSIDCVSYDMYFDYFTVEDYIAHDFGNIIGVNDEDFDFDYHTDTLIDETTGIPYALKVYFSGTLKGDVELLPIEELEINKYNHIVIDGWEYDSYRMYAFYTLADKMQEKYGYNIDIDEWGELFLPYFDNDPKTELKIS